MGLVFGGTTHQVSVTASSSISNVAAITIMFVWKPTTVDATFRYLLWRNASGVTYALVNHNNGKLEWARGYTTTNGGFNSTDTSLVAANNWYITFFTDPGGGVALNMFHAVIGSALAVPAGTPTAGVGSLRDDSATNPIIGLRDTTRRFVGTIAATAWWAEALTQEQCAALYYRALSRQTLKMYHEYGFNGVNAQPDWSGNANAGTVTGATVGDHSPLGPLFSYNRGWQGAFTAAAAPGGRIFKLAGYGGGLSGPPRGLAA